MNKVNAEIESVRKKIEDLKFQLRVEEAVLGRLQGVNIRKHRTPQIGNSPPRKDSMAAYLEKILKDANSPLQVSELVERLKQSGFKTEAKVGLQNLVPSSLNRRADVFIRIKRGVYGLTQRDNKVKTENNLLTE